MCRPIAIIVAVAVLVGCAPGPPRVTGSVQVDPRDCDLPVAAEVVDGFRPPAEPWMAGNRGLTFATGAGQIVRAVAPGMVTFAGRIAHETYVTVRRSDGSDVTYSFLAGTVRVTGESVVTGDPLGVTGTEPFHLGHRDAGAYLDPTPLVDLACGRGHAVLVAIPAR